MKTLLLVAAFILGAAFANAEDIVIKTSGERLRCIIEKEDSTSLYVIITKQGQPPRSMVINKSEIREFERDATPNQPVVTSTPDANAQPNYGIGAAPIFEKPKTILTVGLLQGSSLIGGDFEFALSDNIGGQIGAGFIGFDVALNIHFRPTIKSPCISIQYWNIGIGDMFQLGALSVGYVYRADELFTCQFGLGTTVVEGEADAAPLLLTFSVGVYFPL